MREPLAPLPEPLAPLPEPLAPLPEPLAPLPEPGPFGRKVILLTWAVAAVVVLALVFGPDRVAGWLQWLAPRALPWFGAGA